MSAGISSGFFAHALIDSILRLRKQTPQHWLEFADRQSLGLRVERRIVVKLNELRRALVVLVSLEHVAHVAVHADVVEEVIALENAVILDHPMIGIGNEGLQDSRGDVGMVEGAER